MNLQCYAHDLYHFYFELENKNKEMEKYLEIRDKKGLLVPSIRKKMKDFSVPIFSTSFNSFDTSNNFYSNDLLFIPVDLYHFYILFNEIYHIKQYIKYIHKFINQEIKRFEQIKTKLIQ